MPTVAEDLNSLAPVEVEIDGRTLAGVGVTPDELQAVMEGRSGAADAAAEPDAPTIEPVTTERNTDGTFKKASAKGPQRFSELTAARDEAKRLADEREAENARLKAELESLKSHRPAPATNGNGNGTKPETSQPLAVAAPVARAKPTIDQIGTVYQTYEDYTEDLADWKAEQRFQQSVGTYEKQIRDSVAALLHADWQRRQLVEQIDMTAVNAAIERGKQKYPDFLDVTRASSVEMPWPLLSKIANHPHSEDLQYALAKNPERAQLVSDIFVRDPEAADLILERVLPSGAAASPASTARTGSTTNAPAPYQPVGSGTKTTVPPLDKLADEHGDDFDSSGYRERRAAERKKRG